MKINKLFISAVLICGAISMSLSAQEGMSPYSRFGYGLLNDNATSSQRQMGSVGYAMNSGRQINVMNPASYSAVDSLTFLFDMGLDFTALRSCEADLSNNRYGGGLEYITMQFPITRYMGASLGLIPYSSVGYAFGSEIDNGAVSRHGTGGINQAYIGLSGRLFKGFSVGANFSYLFGNTINDVLIQPTGYTALFEQEIDVRDWHLQTGIQYSFDINRNNKLTLGVIFSPGQNLHGHARVIKYDTNSDEVPDTVSSTKLHHYFSLPDTWGGGINWTWGNRLSIEADFTWQPWSKAKFGNMEYFATTTFTDRWRIGLGAEYVPAPRGSFLQRVAYRAGGFYNNDYMKVGDNSVREYSLSLGFGLPTPAAKTIVNIGFEYRHRQASPNPLLKENYFTVTLGVNFNELWFFQNKIR